MKRYHSQSLIIKQENTILLSILFVVVVAVTVTRIVVIVIVIVIVIMPTYQSKRSVVIDKPIDEVWKLFWDGKDPKKAFGELIAEILSAVKESKVMTEGGDVTVDGVCGRELLMMDGSRFKEMLIKVDNEEHILRYVLSGLPFGDLIGTWYLSTTTDDAGKTELTVEDVVELPFWPPKFLLYPILAMIFPGAADGMLSDYKHYAETGDPSPAKVEAMKKAEGTE